MLPSPDTTYSRRTSLRAGFLLLVLRLLSLSYVRFFAASGSVLRNLRSKSAPLKRADQAASCNLEKYQPNHSLPGFHETSHMAEQCQTATHARMLLRPRSATVYFYRLVCPSLVKTVSIYTSEKTYYKLMTDLAHHAWLIHEIKGFCPTKLNTIIT